MPQQAETELQVGLGTRHPEVPPAGSSESDYLTLAHEVVDKLGVSGAKRDKLLVSFHAFFRSIATVAGPDAIGFIRRKGEYVRPVLDVYVLWSSTLDLTSSSQREDMDRLATVHGALARSLYPYVDSFLEFVNPISSPAIREFRSALRQWAREAKRGRVIACCQIARLDIVEPLKSARLWWEELRSDN